MVRIKYTSPVIRRAPYAPVKKVTTRAMTKQLALVQEDWRAIGRIKNASEELELAAVEAHPESIEFIKWPSEAVQLAAVNKYGWALECIRDPVFPIRPGQTSYAVKLAAVRSSPGVIKLIDNPSEELQLAAVEKSGLSIEYIKNPSHAVQLAAVKQIGWALDVIINHHSIRPSLAVCIEAVKATPWMVRSVCDCDASNSEEWIETVLSHCGRAIQYVRRPTPRMYQAAARQDPKFLLDYACRICNGQRVLSDVAPVLLECIGRDSSE